jgi:prefoldin alpha subunit
LAENETERLMQEKMLIYRTLESRLDALSKQQNMFASKVVEMQNTLDSLDEIKRGANTVLFPLGSAAYARGEVSDKEKFIVELGAGIAVEKNTVEGTAILEKRKKELESAISTMQKDIQATLDTMRQIEEELQRIATRVQDDDKKFRVVPD